MLPCTDARGRHDLSTAPRWSIGALLRNRLPLPSAPLASPHMVAPRASFAKLTCNRCNRWSERVNRCRPSWLARVWCPRCQNFEDVGAARWWRSCLWLSLWQAAQPETRATSCTAGQERLATPSIASASPPLRLAGDRVELGEQAVQAVQAAERARRVEVKAVWQSAPVLPRCQPPIRRWEVPVFRICSFGTGPTVARSSPNSEPERAEAHASFPA